jgi:UDP-glucuronate 4-epimerase
MARGEPIPVYGDGSTRRDYTFIDDIVQGIRGAMAYTGSMYEVINLGNNQTVSLLEMIRTLEQALGTSADLTWLPDQPGDVPQTWASVEKAHALLGYVPRTPFPEGIARFVAWLSEQSRVSGIP